MAIRDDVVATDRGAGRGTTLLTWIALIASLLALWLAWMAYDRTGADLDERVRQQVLQSTNSEQETQETETTETAPQGTTEEGTDTPTDTTDTTTDETTDPATPVQP